MTRPDRILEPVSPSPRHRRILVAGLALAACGGDPQAPVPAPGVVLEVDGLQITAAELSGFDDYFERLDPTMGRSYRTRELLDQLVLPVRLARRAFGAERARERDKAGALADLVGEGGYGELRGRGEPYGGYQPDLPFGRNQLPLPVARFAFEPDNLLRVSPPIEVGQGFCLVATFRLHQGTSSVEDKVEAYVVPFFTHGPGDYTAWWEAEKARIRDRVSYVHPDLRAALPPWLVVP